MRYIIILCLLILLSGKNQIFSQEYVRYTSVIDTPTAFTLGRGTYQLSFFAYDQGGAELETIIGLSDYIYLGASFDTEHLIGKDKPEPNVPGVIAKIKFTDGWEMFPISVAMGYDSFYLGSLGKVDDTPNQQNNEADKLNQMIYGPYFVITKPIYLFDDEQHFSIGMRVPTQPDYIPKDTSYFVSLDIPMGEFFTLKGEIERVYYNFERNDDWLYNWGMRYSVFQKVGLEFNFIKQPKERVNRVLRIEYYDQF
jgi:hypothetical protein